MEVAWGEGVKVVPPLPEFPSFVLVGIEPGVLLGVA